MSPDADSSGQPRERLASPGERLFGARYVLAIVAGSLLATSVFWDVPVPFALAATVGCGLVAALVPRRSLSALPSADPAEAPIWPDRAIAAVVQALPHAAYVLDGAGIVRFANARAAELFPATRSGDPFDLTFRRPEIADAMRAALAGEPSSADYHAPGEATRYYTVSFRPLRLAGNRSRYLLAAFDDVSDRQAIARMRSDFVANASHELRTPLASLTGFIETLLGPARDDLKATEKFLRVMLDQARRMRRLIDDLLLLSRAEMRVHSRPTERVDLVASLRQVADAMTPLAREHNVALALDAPEEPVAVLGDHDQLLQVFQNLVENAIRYGAAGGKVEVTVEPRLQDRRVAVHVQDYGPGIPPEHLPRLTERFYRVDVGASREMKGTGLGLAIVKHILTRHHGDLEIRSRVGEGARFTVVLPLATPVPPP